MPNLSVVSITQPPADLTFVNQPGSHGFYIKPFPAGGGPLTSFADTDNFADNIIGALPYSSTVEAAELVTLSGKRLRGDRTVTAENQTFRANIFRGQTKFDLLFDRVIARKDAASQGQALGFLRTFPDDNAVQGVLRVENMNPEGDPSADAFGYDVEVSFGDFAWVDVRVIPTFTSKTPATGPVGTPIVFTGTNLTPVTSVQFRTGATVVATQSNLTSRSATNFTAASPSGLTAATTYNVFMMYASGEIAAGTFAAS